MRNVVLLIVAVLSLLLCGSYKNYVSTDISNTHATTTPPICESMPETTQHQHEYEIIQSLEPTCEKSGLLIYKCSCCEVKTEEIPALGHNYSSIITEPTCESQGYITHTCLRCGNIYIDSYVVALGHIETIMPAVPATCTSTGLAEGKKCSVCDTVIVPQTTMAVLGHNYNSVITAPTCTEQGYTTYTCLKCGNSYVDSYVNATGHKWGAWKTTEKPTVEKTGAQERKCEFCLLIEHESIDKLPVPVEYINLNNYQILISYNGLTDNEAKIVKELLVEYEKYKREEIEEIRYSSGNYIFHANYLRMNSFFSIYFYNWTDKEKIMSVISRGNDGADALLEKDVIDKYIKEKAEIDNFVEKALSQMTEGSEEYKLRQISDWLRNNFKYNRDIVDAYPAVKSGKGNCNVFALLFKAMASRLGIQCDICIGYSNTGPHAWNMVTLSNGDVKFYDISYYDNGGQTKYLNSTESPWKDYVLNDYWYLNK